MAQKGRLKMNHEKGFGIPWFPKVGLEGFGKAKPEASKGVRVFVMVPKSEVGRA